MNRQYGALGGIAIALIVLNHAIHFGLQIAPVEGGWLGLLILLQALGAFAVPAFLFISGSFVSYSATQVSGAFVRSSLGRILWPYVIWSAVFYSLVFVTSREQYSAAGYVRNLLVGYPYHFVPLLAFWYIAAPILVRAARKRPVLLIAAVAAYQAILIVIRFPEMFGLAGSLPAWARTLTPPVLFSTLADWAIYFPLGLALSLHEGRVKPHLKRWRWGVAAATAALFLLGILNAFEIVTAPWARLVAPVPLMFLLPVITRTSIPLLHRFETLGRESYGLYLSHFVVVNLLVALLAGRSPGLAGYLLILFPLCYLIALAVPLWLMGVIARTPATRSAYRYLFGTTPPARSVRPVELPGALPRTTRHVERPT